MRHNSELILDPSAIYANGATRAEAAAARYQAAGGDDNFRAGIEKVAAEALPVAVVIGELLKSPSISAKSFTGWPLDTYPQSLGQIAAAVSKGEIEGRIFIQEFRRAQPIHDVEYTKEITEQERELGRAYPLMAEYIASKAQGDTGYSKTVGRLNTVRGSLNAAFALGDLGAGIRAGIAEILKSSQTPAEATGRITDFHQDVRQGVDSLHEVIQDSYPKYLETDRYLIGPGPVMPHIII